MVFSGVPFFLRAGFHVQCVRHNSLSFHPWRCVFCPPSVHHRGHSLKIVHGPDVGNVRSFSPPLVRQRGLHSFIPSPARWSFGVIGYSVEDQINVCSVFRSHPKFHIIKTITQSFPTSLTTVCIVSIYWRLTSFQALLSVLSCNAVTLQGTPCILPRTLWGRTNRILMLDIRKVWDREVICQEGRCPSEDPRPGSLAPEPAPGQGGAASLGGERKGCALGVWAWLCTGMQDWEGFCDGIWSHLLSVWCFLSHKFKSQEVGLDSYLAEWWVSVWRLGAGIDLDNLCRVTAITWRHFSRPQDLFLPSLAILFLCVCIKLSLSPKKTGQYKSQRASLNPIPTASVRTNGNPSDVITQWD